MPDRVLHRRDLTVIGCADSVKMTYALGLLARSFARVWADPVRLASMIIICQEG